MEFVKNIDVTGLTAADLKKRNENAKLHKNIQGLMTSCMLGMPDYIISRLPKTRTIKKNKIDWAAVSIAAKRLQTINS